MEIAEKNEESSKLWYFHFKSPVKQDEERGGRWNSLNPSI